MKLCLAVSAGLLGCAGASPVPPTVPIEPAPVTTTTGTCISSEAPSPRIEAVPVNVTVTPPMKLVDPELLEAVKRLPPAVQNITLNEVSALKTIDGKLRLHGKIGFQRTEVTLPPLTSQCEQVVQSAIQTRTGVSLQGKGRGIADNVPGQGYVSAYTLEDVTGCR